MYGQEFDYCRCPFCCLLCLMISLMVFSLLEIFGHRTDRCGVSETLSFLLYRGSRGWKDCWMRREGWGLVFINRFWMIRS